MTPARLAECLDAIGWTRREFARRTRVQPRQADRWAAGEYPVPALIAAWLEQLARYHETHPPPANPAR